MLTNPCDFPYILPDFIKLTLLYMTVERAAAVPETLRLLYQMNELSYDFSIRCLSNMTNDLSSRVSLISMSVYTRPNKYQIIVHI